MGLIANEWTKGDLSRRRFLLGVEKTVVNLVSILISPQIIVMISLLETAKSKVYTPLGYETLVYVVETDLSSLEVVTSPKGRWTSGVRRDE